jgi:hypothetical protein
LDRYVYALKRLRQTISTEAALTAYHGYVASTLRYGLIIWGNSVEVDRVFKIQKKCIRALSGAWFLDSCQPYFKRLGVLPLPCMYIMDMCMFVKLHPSYFKKLIEVSNRPNRAQYTNMLYQPPCNAYIYKQNVYNMCILLYNSLPNRFKSLDGNFFKKALADWLNKKCFYSVKEYLSHKEN